MATQENIGQAPKTATRRIGIFDVVRGFALISMVLWHLCYDLVYLKGIDLPWFSGLFVTVWAHITAWSFLFVAGCMCCLSHNNLKRAALYALVALAIFLITSLAGVDTAINFGIFYCMAACTFVYWLLEKLNLRPKGIAAAIVFFIVFLLVFNLPRGELGIEPFVIGLPSAPYDSGLLSWAGFPGPNFTSGDYYPFLPYLFMYLSGASAGAVWAERGYPTWAQDAHLEPFTWIGQHSLWIYALHQPIILLILSLL